MKDSTKQQPVVGELVLVFRQSTSVLGKQSTFLVGRDVCRRKFEMKMNKIR